MCYCVIPNFPGWNACVSSRRFFAPRWMKEEEVVVKRLIERDWVRESKRDSNTLDSTYKRVAVVEYMIHPPLAVVVFQLTNQISALVVTPIGSAHTPMACFCSLASLSYWVESIGCKGAIMVMTTIMIITFSLLLCRVFDIPRPLAEQMEIYRSLRLAIEMSGDIFLINKTHQLQKCYNCW